MWSLNYCFPLIPIMCSLSPLVVRHLATSPPLLFLPSIFTYRSRLVFDAFPTLVTCPAYWIFFMSAISTIWKSPYLSFSPYLAISDFLHSLQVHSSIFRTSFLNAFNFISCVFLNAATSQPYKTIVRGRQNVASELTTYTSSVHRRDVQKEIVTTTRDRIPTPLALLSS